MDVLMCTEYQGTLRSVAMMDNPNTVTTMVRLFGLQDVPQADRKGSSPGDTSQLLIADNFGAGETVGALASRNHA